MSAQVKKSEGKAKKLGDAAPGLKAKTMVSSEVLPSKVAANIGSAFWAKAGEEELQNVLASEKNDAARWRKIAEKCEDSEDWEAFTKAYRKAALKHCGINPESGEKTWDQKAKEMYQIRFEPRLRYIRRIGKAFTDNGKGWLLEHLSNKDNKPIPVVLSELPKISNRGRTKGSTNQKVNSGAAATIGIQMAEPPKGSTPSPQTSMEKQEAIAKGLGGTIAGLEVAADDDLPALVHALGSRLARAQAPEWQKLSREMVAMLKVYDQRTGDAAPNAKAA